MHDGPEGAPVDLDVARLGRGRHHRSRPKRPRTPAEGIDGSENGGFEVDRLGFEIIDPESRRVMSIMALMMRSSLAGAR